MSQLDITYAKGVSLEDWVKLTGENDRLKAQLAKNDARVKELESSLDEILETSETHSEMGWKFEEFWNLKKAQEAGE